MRRSCCTKNWGSTGFAFSPHGHNVGSGVGGGVGVQDRMGAQRRVPGWSPHLNEGSAKGISGGWGLGFVNTISVSLLASSSSGRAM